jgi:hypothetical protein
MDMPRRGRLGRFSFVLGLCWFLGAGLAGAVRTAELDDKGVAPPTDALARSRLDAARDYLAQEDWANAILLLQRILDRDRETMVPLTSKAADGKEITIHVGLRSEALRMLATLPPKGRAVYEVMFGDLAEVRLKRARQNKDRAGLATIVQRYALTRAGLDALEELARLDAQSGQPLRAGLAFEQLLQERRLREWSAESLYQAARAFQQAGDRANAAFVAKQLEGRAASDGIRLAERVLTREQLRQELAALAPQATDEWPLYGGNPSRSGKGSGGAPFMESLWKNQTVRTEETKQWLAQAASLMQQRHQPMLSGFFPVTATVMKDGKKLPLVIYRSHWGIHAVHMKTGATQWEDISHWSMDRMVRDPNKHPAVSAWVNFYIQQRPSVLLENSTVGSLSADTNYAYMVEDLAVPPPTFPNGMDFDGRWNQGGFARYGQAVADAIQHSRLQAFDLGRGKLIWVLGGKLAGKGELDGCFFRSAPLPLDGQLHVLIEKDQGFRLATLNPLKGIVLSVLPLAPAPTKLGGEPYRRVRAAHLAYADGLLVCPTYAGIICGVDLLSNTMVWTYSGCGARMGDRSTPTPRTITGR